MAGTSPPELIMDREYTLSKINWKRSLTYIAMKRRLAENKEKSKLKFEVIKQIANPSLKFELENFKLFGSLHKSETEIHDTLPTPQTIEAEQKYIDFERHRKLGPHDVKYNEFYQSMTPIPSHSPRRAVSTRPES